MLFRSMKIKSVANKNNGIKNKVIIFNIILFFISTTAFAQNKHFNIGCKNSNISFGNSPNNNGIRFNALDRNVNNINGINISVTAVSKNINGLSVGVLAAADSISNGIKTGGLVTYSQSHNGIAIAGAIIAGKKYNGIGLSGLWIFADTINGLFISPWGAATSIGNDNIGRISGIAIAGTGNYSAKLNGLSVAIFYNEFIHQKGVSISCYNRTEELHGFQFGLINYAGNNRKLFRWLPFINVHLKKKPKSV